MYISGTITSAHAHPEHVVSALSPDSDGFMTVEVLDGCIVASVEGE